MKVEWKATLVFLGFVSLGVLAVELLLRGSTTYLSYTSGNNESGVVPDWASVVDLVESVNGTLQRGIVDRFPPESEENRNWQPPPYDNTTKFITYRWPGYGGRHHNQIIVLMKSLWFAARLNRTLLLEKFRQNKKRWDPWQYYDIDRLSRGMRVPIYPVETFPLKLNETIYKFNIKNWTKGLSDLQDSSTQLLVLQDSTFYVRVPYDLWENETFQHLWPSKPLQQLINLYLSTNLTGPYTGIHVRHLEGDCVKKTPRICKRYNMSKECEEILLRFCTMTVPFVEEVRRNYSRSFQPVFVASDMQKPATTENLVANGALRYNFPPELGSTDPVYTMAIDYWLMVLSDLFIRNHVSTVSLNVIRKRNTMPTAGPTYMGLPVFNYGEYEVGGGKRSIYEYLNSFNLPSL